MAKRKVEVFTAGCPVCEDAVKLVKAAASVRTATWSSTT